ncbi:MAG: hypothetical protein KF752_10985 [Pirellulaceae bacterium]|nr:hypothetical protein [Pirellulaceae bacterium]
MSIKIFADRQMEYQAASTRIGWYETAQRRWQHRRGTLLVMVLVCTMVAMSLVAIALRATIVGRQSCRIELQRQQAAYLLEAGVQRAKSGLSHDHEQYPGEHWNVHNAFRDYELALIEVTRSPAAGAISQQWSVTASLGNSRQPHQVIRLTRNVEVPVPPPSANP